MTLKKLKFMVFMVCVALFLATTITYAAEQILQTNTVRMGVFNSQKSAQKFYKSIPTDLRHSIKNHQLWLSIKHDISQFSLYYIDISNLDDGIADQICSYVRQNDFQCEAFKRIPFAPIITKEIPKKIKKSHTNSGKVFENKPPVTKKIMPKKKLATPVKTSNPAEKLVAVKNKPIVETLSNYKEPIENEVETLTNYEAKQAEPAYNFDYTVVDPLTPHPFDLHQEPLNLDNFSLALNDFDDGENKAAKAAYASARDRFLDAVRNTGEGINNGNGGDAAKQNLLNLGKNAFESASNVYLNQLIKTDRNGSQTLANDAGVSKTFIHHVRQNFAESAQETVKGLVSTALSGGNDNILDGKIDSLALASARDIIEASLSAARKSDLYLLRHLEFEYTLNDFNDSYFSVLGVQPLYQSDDLKHNIFFQGGGIINEQSIDINDDENRHTLNLGLAYRQLTSDEKYLLGANVFYDHQWPFNHSRVSLGVDAQSADLSLAANYYVPVSGFEDTRIDSSGNQLEETALQGYDVEVGYDIPQIENLTLFAKGYQYFRDDLNQDDLLGVELSAEYQFRENFTLRGALVEENGGRDGFEVALQYSVPLYDIDQPNLAHAELKKNKLRSKIFEKVRRENRIRVGERLSGGSFVSAQFNGSSIGLPFDVGGTLTGAGVDLLTDTAITVPSGDFGIINFNNGAIANVSASGGGDVILEFNATTLTVTATNGGFVQFISGSGSGITTVNVPGGTVNLLGTDIDVTDDGTITTVQVRSGSIDVVPTVGAAILGGSQADIVRLGIANGLTSTLVNPDLETRQEAAFTNLDLINPNPAAVDNEAPFINALPELITGPQFVGNNADLRLTLTQPVTVTGTPQISALVGANLRTFAYVASASTSTQLVFRHTYIAADVGAAFITTQDFSLNGGAIQGTTNSLDAITAFTDTTVAVNDGTMPSLISSTPVDNDSGVIVSDNIVLNFDEMVAAGLGNIFINDTTDATDNRIIPINDSQVSISGSTITVNLTIDLEVNSDYEVIIDSGVIEDTNGNDFIGLTSGDLNFNTNDTTPPSFTSIVRNTPATTITNADTLVFRATFNENVVNVDASDFTITGTTATITTVTPINSTIYDLTVSGGDLATLNGTVGVDLVGGQNITDIAANALPNSEPPTDETYILDNLAPVVNLGTAIPANGAIQVARNSGSDITLQFLEASGTLFAGTGSLTLTDTDDGSDIRIIPATDPQVTITGTTVDIDLTTQMEYAENYEITFDADFIQDQSANSVIALGTGNLVFKTVNLEESLTLSLNINSPDDNVNQSNIQGSGQTINGSGTYVFAVDLTIPALPNGTIFECGGSGQGQFVGFNNADGVLRLRGGEGGVSAPATNMANLEFPIGSIVPGDYTLTFEYDFSLLRIRGWLDETSIGSATPSGGSLDSNRWNGGDECTFADTVTSSLTTGEPNAAFNGPILSDFRYYNTQTIP